VAKKHDWEGGLKQELIEAVRKHGQNWRVVADVIGVPDGAIEAHWRRHLRNTPDGARAIKDYLASTIQPPEEASTPEKAFEQRSAGIDVRDQIKELQKELNAAAKEKNLGDTLRELAEQTAPKLPPASPLWKPKPVTKERTIETMCQFWSDWHLFESVSLERTRGHQEYNAGIGAKRVGQNVAAHTSIVQRLRRSGWEFPELMVFLGGDFHPGTIHELERHSSDGANAVLHAYGTAWLIAQALRDLSRLYDKVKVAGVPGNHGRLPDAKRVQQKDPTRNWDYMIYLLVKQMLSEVENIEFWFPNSYAAQVEIRGWNFLLNHGHEIRSWMGIPWYGMKRKIAQITALEAARGNLIHYHLYGQFHQGTQIPHAAGEAFVNGSLPGGNEFSLEALGEMSPPSQLMFGVHEEHGVTHRWPVKLDRIEDGIPEYSVTPWEEVQDVGEKGVRKWRIA